MFNKWLSKNVSPKWQFNSTTECGTPDYLNKIHKYPFPVFPLEYNIVTPLKTICAPLICPLLIPDAGQGKSRTPGRRGGGRCNRTHT